MERLVRRRRSVDIAGRRFDLTSPTVATVVELLRLFPCEVMALVDASQRFPILPEHIGIVLARRAADARHVLDTCVLGPAGNWPVLRLVEELGSMLIDPGAAVAALGLGEKATAEAGDMTEGLVQIAKQFHFSPHDLMDWPFEEFLAIRAEKQQRPATAAELDALQAGLA